MLFRVINIVYSETTTAKAVALWHQATYMYICTYTFEQKKKSEGNINGTICAEINVCLYLFFVIVIVVVVVKSKLTFQFVFYELYVSRKILTWQRISHPTVDKTMGVSVCVCVYVYWKTHIAGASARSHGRATIKHKKWK